MLFKIKPLVFITSLKSTPVLDKPLFFSVFCISFQFQFRFCALKIQKKNTLVSNGFVFVLRSIVLYDTCLTYLTKVAFTTKPLKRA